MIFAAASTIAVPLCISDFEPPLPPPMSSRSLSPCTSVIFSNGMPSFSLNTCANGVAWPMPKSSVPVVIVTVPSALNAMSASSFDGGAVTSRKLPMPRPRSLPRRGFRACGAPKPLPSASSKRLFGQRGEVAAVVSHVGSGLVRQILRPNLIAPAQRQRDRCRSRLPRRRSAAP